MRATTLTTRYPNPWMRGATRTASGKKPTFVQRANFSAVMTTGLPRKSGGRVRAGAGTAYASAAAGAGGQEEMLPLPQEPLQMVKQAAAAVKAGLEDGRRRQKLKLLLPVNEKEFSFMSTEAMDYPCSLKKEFDTCCEVVKLLVEAVTGTPPQEQLMRRIDDGGVEGEPCAVIYPPTKDFLAVVFPTAERLKTLRSLAEEEQRPLLIVNSQWNEAGQVVSDFGIGPWKRAADEFLGCFEPVYVHYEQRIGAPGSIDPVTGERYVAGGVLRVLRAYPGPHQVFAMAVNGSSQMLSAFQDEPQYRELETLLEKGRSAKLEIFAVAQEASRMLSQPELDEEDMPEPDVSRAGEDSLSESQIQALDAVSTRRYLAKLGLPTSGKLSKLKDRLKQALAQEA